MITVLLELLWAGDAAHRCNLSLTIALHLVTGQGSLGWQGAAQICSQSVLCLTHGCWQTPPSTRQTSLWHTRWHLCAPQGKSFPQGAPQDTSDMWHGIFFLVCRKVKKYGWRFQWLYLVASHTHLFSENSTRWTWFIVTMASVINYKPNEYMRLVHMQMNCKTHTWMFAWV